MALSKDVVVLEANENRLPNNFQQVKIGRELYARDVMLTGSLNDEDLNVKAIRAALSKIGDMPFDFMRRTSRGPFSKWDWNSSSKMPSAFLLDGIYPDSEPIVIKLCSI
jgi:hypothetical protein